jgi:hypothetical protein
MRQWQSEQHWMKWDLLTSIGCSLEQAELFRKLAEFCPCQCLVVAKTIDCMDSRFYYGWILRCLVCITVLVDYVPGAVETRA